MVNLLTYKEIAVNVIVELVGPCWHVVEAGTDSPRPFNSGAEAFEAASRLVRATPHPADSGGRITVRAFGASVEALAVV